jgi:hypothetical protein
VFLENWVPAPATRRLSSPPAPGDDAESPTFLGILEYSVRAQGPVPLTIGKS